MIRRILFLAMVLAASLTWGAPTPPIRITTLDGKVLTNKTLKGKVVVIDFWATWCGPCRQVSKMMQAIQAKYAAKKLLVVCVDVKEPSPALAAVVKYKATHGYSYPFSVDNGEIDKTFNVAELPTVIVLDPSGAVAYRHTTLEGLKPSLDKSLTKLMGN